MPTQLSSNYLRYNQEQTKDVSIVVVIDGLDLLTNRPIFTRIRYGDPGIHYGDPGVIYGGLRKIDSGVRSILSLDGSSLVLSQRNEPEQGRASVSTLTMAFVDKDGYMTQAISRGVLIPDILGRPVKVYLGYEQLSWPEDYLKIFRGRVSSSSAGPGLITLEFSDPNINRRENFFINAKTKNTTNLLATDTTIPVADNSDFLQHILGPNGTYDVGGPWNPNGTYNPLLVGNRDGVRTFIKIQDEYIEYGPLGYGHNTFTGVVRGARGTVAATHDLGNDVTGAVEFQGNAMEMALKLMLSGWAGPWITRVAAYSFVSTFDPILMNQPGAIIFPDKLDTKDQYGLTTGDYITIVGGVNNGITGRIVRFADLFDTPNRIVYIDQTLAAEYPTSATLSFRSQYDTYPIALGNGLTPEDVDVDAHQQIEGDFINGPENSLRFFRTSASALKSFLEAQVYLPTNTYSLTQRGKLSVGFTKPPIADETLLFLAKENILNADQIKPMRGLNNRKFFNEIDWEYDFDDNGTAVSFFKDLDVDSLSTIGVNSILPISAQGIRTDLGSFPEIQRRSRFLLSRYKNAASLIDVKVNWQYGSQIEAGDIVALKDDGFLQISNIQTGERNLGTQLFEVLERSLDIRSGTSQLRLVSDTAFDATDRFATISPSSRLVSGTTDFIIIKDSYGAIFPGDESRKYQDYIGLPFNLHTEDYSQTYSFVLTGIDTVNIYKLFISNLSSLPPDFSVLIMDIADFANTPLKTDLQLYKTIHCFFSPQVGIVSGATTTQFNVASGDINKFFIGSRIIVHLDDYSITSPEVKVLDINTGTFTITVDQSLGFTPDNTYLIEGIGFPDKSGFYRYI